MKKQKHLHKYLHEDMNGLLKRWFQFWILSMISQTSNTFPINHLEYTNSSLNLFIFYASLKTLQGYREYRHFGVDIN